MQKVALFILIAFSVQAQSSKSFFEESLQKNKKGMLLLGAWGVGNVLHSGTRLAVSDFSTQSKSFHQMNLGWGAINATIAGLGYLGSKKKEIPTAPLSILEEQQKIQTTFLVNGALDMGYMAFGLYLSERAKNDMENGARLKGFGQSIILQGAALAIFDAVMFGVQRKHYNSNRSVFEFNMNPTSASVKINFD